jgi:hypothetical protein
MCIFVNLQSHSCLAFSFPSYYSLILILELLLPNQSKIRPVIFSRSFQNDTNNTNCTEKITYADFYFYLIHLNGNSQNAAAAATKIKFNPSPHQYNKFE